MTAHELAQRLLDGPDLPVFNEYHDVMDELRLEPVEPKVNDAREHHIGWYYQYCHPNAEGAVKVIVL